MSIMDILFGIFFGAQAALLGYLASNDLPKSWTVIFTRSFWTCFSPLKASKTIILGAIMGALGVFTAANVISGEEGIVIMNFASVVVILGIQKLADLIVRRTPLSTAWEKLKAFMLSLLEPKEPEQPAAEPVIIQAEQTPA